MKPQRLFTLLLLVFILALPVLTQAQGPQQLTAALTDLSARLGRTITVNDLTDWSWNESLYNDTSLGCPQAGQTYAQVVTRGFQFILTVDNVTYDYRVSEDQTIVILCGSTSSAESCQVAAGQIPFIETRLAVGQQARVAPNITVSLRTDPARGSVSLADIPPDTVLDIINGPRCALGSLLYWQVRYNSPTGPITGWVAEGYDGEYYLEPLTPTAGQPETRARITAGNVAGIVDLFTVGGGFSTTAISPDSRYLATGDSTGELVLFEIGTGEEVFSTDSRAVPIATLVFSTDGSLVAALGGGVIDVFNWSSGTNTVFTVTEENAVVTLTAMAFSPLRVGESPQSAGILLVAAGSIDGRIWVWDFGAPTTPLVTGLQAHNAAVQSVQFSPNGTALITVGADGGVRIWGIGSSTSVG